MSGRAAERLRAAAFVERAAMARPEQLVDETAGRRRHSFQKRLCVPAPCRMVRHAAAHKRDMRNFCATSYARRREQDGGTSAARLRRLRLLAVRFDDM